MGALLPGKLQFQTLHPKPLMSNLSTQNTVWGVSLNSRNHFIAWGRTPIPSALHGLYHVSLEIVSRNFWLRESWNRENWMSKESQQSPHTLYQLQSIFRSILICSTKKFGGGRPTYTLNPSPSPLHPHPETHTPAPPTQHPTQKCWSGAGHPAVTSGVVNAVNASVDCFWRKETCQTNAVLLCVLL